MRPNRSLDHIQLKAICLSILIVFGLGCRRDRNHPGYEYAGDMAKSVAYETYSDNPFFKDGKTARTPVKGTIPRGIIPYQYENNDDGLKKAGLELVNPLEETEQNIERGKKIYQVFCLMCHGETGAGDGLLYTSKKFPIEPVSFLKEKSLGRSEGELFHIITNGGVAMGSHAAQIKPDDRWKVVLYVMNVLQKRNN